MEGDLEQCQRSSCHQPKLQEEIERNIRNQHAVSVGVQYEILCAERPLKLFEDILEATDGGAADGGGSEQGDTPLVVSMKGGIHVRD